MPYPEATVSLRFVMPFLRITQGDPRKNPIFAREGLTLRHFADPDARIRHGAMMELLTHTVASTRDRTIGLRAGESIDASDMGALEHLTRSCADLREAILCSNRYMCLMHEAQEARLVEHEDEALATLELRITDGVPQHPAANDFALTAACTYGRRYTGQRNVLREVHFMHDEPTSVTEYARIFDGARIRLGMPSNALVFVRSHLDAPMPHAHPALQAAFDLEARAMLARLTPVQTLGERVRELVRLQLRTGDVTRETIARQLAMSVPTLQRRLKDEGTTHSDLLDDIRKELAERYLSDRKLAISEVAFLLGFSNVSAFYKAFHRWSGGKTPAEFRARGHSLLGTSAPPGERVQGHVGTTAPTAPRSART